MCRETDGCSAYPTCIASIDARRRRFIERVVPLAHRVFVLNPELAHYVPGAVFLPYANVPVEEIEIAPPPARERALVLHAPSDDSIKGSRAIEASLRELEKEYDFEYIAVRGKPHHEAMALYAQADLVIDQVLAGWYGGFAVELMSMGKPVACYLRDEDFGVLPPAMRAELPLVRVDPRRLTADLAAAFERRKEWRAIGEAARRYVLRWHNPRRIAAAMLKAYRDPQSRFELRAEG
jgi:hypothetical protein